MSQHSYGIFSDPVFIRRNILLNFLHSNFPTEDFQQKSQIYPSPDHLRASYHNLNLVNNQTQRSEAVSLVLNTLSTQSETLSELDWFYCERILIHFANFKRPVPDRIVSLLNRH